MFSVFKHYEEIIMIEELNNTQNKEVFIETLKDSLKEKLQHGIGSVEFKKSDGSIRTLLCTLVPDLLPLVVEEYDEFGNTIRKATKKENPEVLAVWDLDNEDWRSFRYDSVISIAVDYDVTK